MSAQSQASERDLEQLREATRAAHEATKDLRATIRDARSVVEEIERTAGEQVDQRIAAAVAAGLDDYKATLSKAIEQATDAVFARFDTIRATLLGETRGQIRRGESIPQLIEGRRS